MSGHVEPRCIYCHALLAHCEAHPCGRRLQRRAEAHLEHELQPVPGFTTWRVTDRNDRVRTVEVAARTQAQRDRSKRNVENPPPPENHKRHGTLESLR
jgi:hypothetical protein